MDPVSFACCLAAMFCWGAAPVMYRFCGDELSPQKMQTMRSFVFFISSLFVIRFLPSGDIFPGAVPILVYITMTMVDLGIGDTLYFMCVARIGAGKASALANTYPLYVVTFSWLLFGEGLSPLGLLGAVAVVAGIALLCLFKEQGTSETYGHRPIREGLLLGVCAGLCWGTGMPVTRWLMTRTTIGASELMFWRSTALCLYSCLVYIPTRLSGRDKSPFLRAFLTPKGSLMIVSGLFVLMLPGWLSTYAAARASAALMAPITGSAPMVAALMGHWLFKERLTPAQWLGVASIITGGVMVNLL